MSRIRLVLSLILFVPLGIQAQEKTWERRAELSYVQTTGNSRSETASFNRLALAVTLCLNDPICFPLEQIEYFT